MEDEITTTNTYWTFCMTLFVFFFPNDLQIKKKKQQKLKICGGTTIFTTTPIEKYSFYLRICTHLFLPHGLQISTSVWTCIL